VKRIFILFFCYFSANVAVFLNKPNFYNNLELEQITSLLNSLGFIVCCCSLALNNKL